MDSNLYVIDTDCLNFLLNSQVGRKLLQFIELRLPPSIYGELNIKERRDLEKLNFKLIELDNKDKKIVEKLIWQMHGDKEKAISYRKNRNPHHTGECEGAALARKLKCRFVLNEKKANSIIKKTLKWANIQILSIRQFGEIILTSNNLKELGDVYLDELFKELLIR